jgi:seryl-tRNA synthetase
VADLLALDEEARALRARVEATRAERGRLSKAVGEARKAGRAAPDEEAAARALGEALGREESTLRDVEERRDAVLVTLPNLAEDDAPDGGEDDAVELRKVGVPPQFDFEPRDHVDLATAAGALDLDQAAKVSGSRFAYLKGPLVRLQLALVTFALDTLEGAGFTPVIPPVLVREEAMWAKISVYISIHTYIYIYNVVYIQRCVYIYIYIF